MTKRIAINQLTPREIIDITVVLECEIGAYFSLHLDIESKNQTTVIRCSNFHQNLYLRDIFARKYKRLFEDVLYSGCILVR